MPRPGRWGRARARRRCLRGRAARGSGTRGSAPRSATRWRLRPRPPPPPLGRKPYSGTGPVPWSGMARTSPPPPGRRPLGEAPAPHGGERAAALRSSGAGVGTGPVVSEEPVIVRAASRAASPGRWRTSCGRRRGRRARRPRGRQHRVCGGRARRTRATEEGSRPTLQWMAVRRRRRELSFWAG